MVWKDSSVQPIAANPKEESRRAHEDRFEPQPIYKKYQKQIDEEEDNNGDKDENENEENDNDENNDDVGKDEKDGNDGSQWSSHS